MKLYLLEQNDNNGYDIYDSLLVCAENEADAITIGPDGELFKEADEWADWALSKESITCKEIGEANEMQERGVIISSFNAG